MELVELIDCLADGETLTREQYRTLIEGRNSSLANYLFSKAVAVRQQYYGNEVYIRGLIEFSNYCKNDCYYCGIRHSNANAQRYRLEPGEILACCQEGYELGFRTFVLQSGEDLFYTPQKLADLVAAIKRQHPDCAVTLSVGERERDVYQLWFDAGADRYLLRHETADEQHYQSLHPDSLSFRHRMQCLWNLKEIGYQTGCGFMVGSPGQKAEHLAQEMVFLKNFQPQMTGIGPFIPQKDTPFAAQTAGTLELTLFLLGLIRLTLPSVLLPATTALGTIHPQGRELGILAGANVCMPNLSPLSVRKKYTLYDNKICTGEEGAQCSSCLNQRMEKIGYHIVTDRGDYRKTRA